MGDEDVTSLEEVVPDVEADVQAVPVIKDRPLDPPKYEVRPLLGEKFQAEASLHIINQSMEQLLTGRQYKADQVAKWCKQIANGVRQQVQGLYMKRYKIIVQVFILEMKGAGIKCAQRCIWDPETDDFISGMFRNDSLYCHTSVYGVYLY